MANISAKMVGDLKKKTGAGLMDCKRALVETNGDVDAAIKILREKGLAAAAKKADRIAADGLVSVLKDGNTVAMVEVNSETDFVAKNATFVEFVQGILRTVIAFKPATIEELKACKFDGTEYTVEETIKDKIYTIGENITLRRFTVIEGITSTYIHGNGSIGVIVKFDVDAAVAETAEFVEFAKNIALQAGAYATPYLDRDHVPASVINEEKEVIMGQITNDPKNASKPAAIIEKMAIGKLGKFYEENCLVDKEYIKEDNMKVSQYIASTAKALGTSIKVVEFARFEKGEGIEKREDNLGDEVAKMLGK
ncbi:MAG: elongation factor Ts [Clostridia bacterium]|nr:elongation factor Ts [Clostridia bacterium]